MCFLFSELILRENSAVPVEFVGSELGSLGGITTKFDKSFDYSFRKISSYICGRKKNLFATYKFRMALNIKKSILSINKLLYIISRVTLVRS